MRMINVRSLFLGAAALVAICACSSERTPPSRDDRSPVSERYPAKEQTTAETKIVEWRVREFNATWNVEGVSATGEPLADVFGRKEGKDQIIEFDSGGSLGTGPTGQTGELTPLERRILEGMSRDLNFMGEYGWLACAAIPGLAAAYGLACAADHRPVAIQRPSASPAAMQRRRWTARSSSAPAPSPATPGAMRQQPSGLRSLR